MKNTVAKNDINREGGGGNKNTTTTTHPQSRHQGGDERRGEARGRPCRSAYATCRRVGHQATRPTQTVNVQAINADSSSGTATTKHNCGARGTTSAGGGRGAPCAATRLTPPVNAQAINAVLKNINKRLTWHWGRAGEDMMLATTDERHRWHHRHHRIVTSSHRCIVVVVVAGPHNLHCRHRPCLRHCDSC